MGKGSKFGGKGKAWRKPAFGGRPQQPVTAGRTGEREIAPGVPTWNGDPDLFAAFEQAAEWYCTGLKASEKKLAASHVWANLRGSAALAVSRLQAKDFEKDDGLRRLLDFLRETPLAKQPLPDAYQKIDTYRSVKRQRGEHAGQYVLREQEAYV